MLRIKELREEAMMTQKQLAEKISNMQRNISNWEQGVSEPDLRTVVNLADFFGVTLDELFGREQPSADSAVIKADNTDAKLIGYIKRLSSAQKLALAELLKSFKEI